jgi:hypothetical protein
VTDLSPEQPERVPMDPIERQFWEAFIEEREDEHQRALDSIREHHIRFGIPYTEPQR